MEVWKPIPGWEGRYEVSDHGNVRSVPRERQKKELLMRTFEHIAGYTVVWFRKPGEHKKFFVHRLVAEVFLENPDGKKIVNHRDCNKQHNHVTNLEWMTNSENTNYYYQQKKVDNSDF